MKQKRRKFSAEFKAKVALEAIKEQKSLAQLAQEYEVNPVMISKWKSEFLANMAAVFSNSKAVSNDNEEARTEKLYAQIGQLKVELDFLKKSAKKLGIPENEWKP
jgi:transposase